MISLDDDEIEVVHFEQIAQGEWQADVKPCHCLTILDLRVTYSAESGTMLAPDAVRRLLARPA